MAKRSVAYKLSDHTLAQLAELAAAMNDTKTGVLSLAVDRLYRDTFPAPRPVPPDDGLPWKIHPAGDGPPDD